MKTLKNFFVLGFWFIESLIFISACNASLDTEDKQVRGANPEALAWKYSYDDAGRITLMVGPGGKETKIQYKEDNKHNIQQITTEFADSSKVMLGFNPLGQRVSMADAAGKVQYEYDNSGYLTSVRREKSSPVLYTYDTLDRLKTLKVGDFYTVEYTYDFLGRLASMKTPAGIIEYKYLTGQGQVVRTLPNGVKTFWKYEPNGQLRQIIHGFFRNPKDSSYIVLAEYTYQYRPDGLIEAIREKSSGGDFLRTYEYDKVGRLIHAVESGQKEYSYEYDNIGNRLRTESTGNPTQVCTYDWAGRLKTLDSNPCVHDVVGNLTSYIDKNGLHAFEFNAANFLKSASAENTKVEYEYDGDGCLITRAISGKKTKFIPDALADIWRPLISTDPDGKQTLYIWEGDLPLAAIRGKETKFFLHDHVGSVRLFVDDKGKVLQQIAYEPFGTGKTTEIAQEITPLFGGLFWDTEANGYLTKARIYLSTLGRFLQIDPQYSIFMGSQKDLSHYAYCGGDPINFRDLDGTTPQDLSSVYWNAFWSDVFGHLFDATRAKEILATFSESHLANARGSGIAAGITATFLDIVGGYIPGKAASENQLKAQWAWSLAFLGGPSIFTNAAGAISAFSYGRTAGSVVINTYEGNLFGALLDLTSMGLYMGSRNVSETLDQYFPPGYQHEFPFTPSAAYNESLFEELRNAQVNIQVATKFFNWGKFGYSVQKNNIGALAKFIMGQFLNFKGRKSNWIGANRSGDEPSGQGFSWAKDSLGRFPLGDTTIGVKSREDRAAKWHDIQDWVNWHADAGTEVKVPWENGTFKYFISRGKENSTHDWEVILFATGLRSNYPISDSPRTSNPVELSELRERYSESKSLYSTGVVVNSEGDGRLPIRIYRTDQELPQTVHTTMVEQGLRGLAFDGVIDPIIIAYGKTEEDAKAMKAVVLAYNPKAKVVTKWGTDDLSGANIVFEMSSKAKKSEQEEKDRKRPRRNDFFPPFFPPPPPPPPSVGFNITTTWDGDDHNDDWPPPPNSGIVLSPSNVGGVFLGGAGSLLEGLGLLEGIAFDENGNLVLIGKAGDQIKLPPLRLDDVVTVFRSVYLFGECRTVTIDPNPSNPEGPIMIIKHSESTKDTYVGWVLYEADRLMKGYTIGADNMTGQDLKSSIPGYNNVSDKIYFGGVNPEKQQMEGHWERFWIVPAEERRFDTLKRELTLFDIPLKVNTQTMKWENGELVDDLSNKSSPGALAFTDWFNKNYDLISKERFLTPPPESGITEPVPVYTELRRIALITAIAEKLRDQGVPLPFWMRDYDVRPVSFEKTTPGLKVSRSNKNIEARIYGGVNLTPGSEDVKNFTAKTDLSKLPKNDQKLISDKVKLADSLEKVIKGTMASAVPLKVQEIKHEGTPYKVVALPGAQTRALAPCQLDEIDMEVPGEGGNNIQLVRSYNSFFDPKGLWGKGWILNLPYLNEIKIPVKRDAEHVQYQMAYELITPLNSIYSRFSRIEEVPELNKSRLQVPDQSCEFFGIADAHPEFLSGPTHQVIRKDGSI